VTDWDDLPVWFRLLAAVVLSPGKDPAADDERAAVRLGNAPVYRTATVPDTSMIQIPQGLRQCEIGGEAVPARKTAP